MTGPSNQSIGHSANAFGQIAHCVSIQVPLLLLRLQMVAEKRLESLIRCVSSETGGPLYIDLPTQLQTNRLSLIGSKLINGRTQRIHPSLATRQFPFAVLSGLPTQTASPSLSLPMYQRPK